jgi:hypothetical protein
MDKKRREEVEQNETSNLGGIKEKNKFLCLHRAYLVLKYFY